MTDDEDRGWVDTHVEGEKVRRYGDFVLRVLKTEHVYEWSVHLDSVDNLALRSGKTYEHDEYDKSDGSWNAACESAYEEARDICEPRVKELLDRIRHMEACLPTEKMMAERKGARKELENQIRDLREKSTELRKEAQVIDKLVGNMQKRLESMGVDL